jgi:multiple sugar transport system substrate-binding protein
MKKTPIFLLLTFLISCSGNTSGQVSSESSSLNTYTVSFDSNEGTLVPPQIVEINSFISPPNVSKEGHTLEGWYTSLNGGVTLENKWNFFTDRVNFNFTLYANWTINQYAINFNTNGGSSIDTQTITYKESLSFPNTTKVGHTFGGWYTDIDLNQAFTLLAMPAYNFTLYAKWVINQYTITFDSQGGSIISSIIASYSQNIDILIPTKVGHTFNGWFMDIEMTQAFNLITMPAYNFTLYAKWVINQYTITFDSQGGSSISSITANYGDAITPPDIPTRDGYAFDRWEPSLPTNMPAYDYFVDAIWTPITLEEVSISYAGWGNQVFNQRMIDSFEAKYPNINVHLREDIVGFGDSFTGNLIASAQAGLLPDVFVTDYVPSVINAGLTLDIAEFWNEDEDAALVYDNIALTGLYNNQRFAIPSTQYLKGVMINLDIFEKANLYTVTGKYRIDNDGYPVKDWTFEEMINIAKEIKNFDLLNTENLVIGLDTWYGAPDFQQVWPTMDNANTQYDTWDGTQFNYTSDSWIEAMQAKVNLHQLTDGTTTRFTDQDYNAEENYILRTYMIQEGHAAMDIEGSWQFWVIKDAIDNRDFELGFWPYPQGSAGLYPPTILDFQAVSSQTEHPEEAYLFAKWMSYGRDGWDARLDLLEEERQEALDAGDTPTFLDRFPVADYPGVWDRVEGLVDGIEGIDSILNRIAFSKPDLDKWLPGYRDFWAWVYDPQNPYNWENLVAAGPTAVANFAQQWENYINQLVQQQLSSLVNI